MDYLKISKKSDIGIRKFTKSLWAVYYKDDSLNLIDSVEDVFHFVCSLRLEGLKIPASIIHKLTQEMNRKDV